MTNAVLPAGNADTVAGRETEAEIAAFGGDSLRRFARDFTDPSDDPILRPDPWCVLLGPIWAGGRGLAWLFWVLCLSEVTLITVLAVAFKQGHAGTIAVAAIAYVLLRLAAGIAGPNLLAHRFLLWQYGEAPASRIDSRRIVLSILTFGVLLVVALAAYLPDQPMAWLRSFPAMRPVSAATEGVIDAATVWLADNLAGFFGLITLVLRQSLDMLERALLGVPWPILAILIVLYAKRIGNWPLAAMVALGLGYLGVYGFWEKSISTVSLIGVAAFICILIGLPVGILCAKFPPLMRPMRALMDFMQTMPSFVYLIPAVAFFSIGKPPSIIATVIFGIAPMIRLTALGIQQVPDDVKEACRAFGASRMQLLFKVEIPLAAPTIMAGVNQTIMMCLSMVIIAAMIGAGGLGNDILQALRYMRIGQGALAGIAIVVCAMIIDRLVQMPGERQARRQTGA